MIDYENAIPIRVYNGFRFILEHGPYYIVYFSENSEFLKDRPKLSFRQIDFRDIALANTVVVRTHITGKQIQEYRDVKLTSKTPDKISKNKNIIIDSTIYTNKIDKKFSPVTYQNRYGEMIYKNIFELFSFVPNKSFKRIFFYSIDKKTFKKSSYQKNKFFIFLKNIKTKNLFFDDLILCIIDERKVIYRIIIKNQELDYNKFLYYIMNI